jgi:hypothetical protein
MIIRLEDPQHRWQAAALLRAARHQLRVKYGKYALPDTHGTLVRATRIASYLVDKSVMRAMNRAILGD